MIKPMQPIVVDKHSVPRFQENAIVSYLLDWASSRGCSLNDLALLPFSDADREQFAQLIGYSVSGYGDLPYVSDDSYAKALCIFVTGEEMEVGNK